MAPRPQNSQPAVDRDDALRIAMRFVEERELPIRTVLNVRHYRPIRLGRDDDRTHGTWSVAFKSAVSPDPPNVVTSPAPDSPIVIEINDRTGAASQFYWL